jgi:hypothetical protein
MQRVAFRMQQKCDFSLPTTHGHKKELGKENKRDEEQERKRAVRGGILIEAVEAKNLFVAA